jgi:hypothetical protein
MFDGRLLRPISRHRWREDIARPVLFVPNMSFIFENTQQRAHGGIAWSIGKIFTDLSGCSPSPLVENIHYLTLTTAQRLVLSGHANYLALLGRHCQGCNASNLALQGALMLHCRIGVLLGPE